MASILVGEADPDVRRALALSLEPHAGIPPRADQLVRSAMPVV